LKKKFFIPLFFLLQPQYWILINLNFPFLKNHLLALPVQAGPSRPVEQNFDPGPAVFCKRITSKNIPVSTTASKIFIAGFHNDPGYLTRL